MSAATRFAPTSAVAKSRIGVKTNAPRNRDMFSIANAKPMRCSEERKSLAHGWGVDIEHLPFVLGVGVGKATVDLRLIGKERRGAEKDEEESEDAHDNLQNVDVVLFNLIFPIVHPDQQGRSPAHSGAGILPAPANSVCQRRKEPIRS